MTPITHDCDLRHNSGTFFTAEAFGMDSTAEAWPILAKAQQGKDVRIVCVALLCDGQVAPLPPDSTGPGGPVPALSAGAFVMGENV